MIEKVTLPVSISRDWSVHCRSSDKSASLNIDSRNFEKRSYNIIVQGVKEAQNIFSANENGGPKYWLSNQTNQVFLALNKFIKYPGLALVVDIEIVERRLGNVISELTCVEKGNYQRRCNLPGRLIKGKFFAINGATRNYDTEK
jgi:hypothetical protein